MDMQKEFDRIAAGISCLDDYMTWVAFQADPQLEEFLDDETYVRFMEDAVKAAERVRYDLRYDEIIDLAVSEYEGLLKKYGYTEDMLPLAFYCMFREFLRGRIEVFNRISLNEGGPENLPELPEEDIDNLTMATIFADLPPQPEVAEYLEEVDVHYDYDHLHMVTWFSAQMTHGNGHYSRSEHNYSAKTTYNRLLNPFSLLWIAAALGEDKDLVIRTGREMADYATYSAKCGVVRRAIPWKRIHELALRMWEEENSEEEDGEE